MHARHDKRNIYKVLFYESGSGFGGSAVSLYRLTKYLDRGLYKPIAVVHGIGPRISKMAQDGVPVHTTRLYRVVSGSMRLSEGFSSIPLLKPACFYSDFLLNTLVNCFLIIRIIKRNNVDFVHLNNGIFENFPALLAAQLSGIPCISHVRGTEELTRIERVCGKRVDGFITLNSAMYNLYRGVFGEGKVFMILNGVDLDEFKGLDQHRLRSEFKIPEGSVIVGTIARLIPGKGLPEFLKAAAQVARVRKDVLFFIVGDDPLKNHLFEQELRLLALKEDLNGRVVFTGWRNDVLDVMAGLDLVVQCSTFPEGMSLTPIEAAALGKPVITSDVPGYSDSVEDGVTGFIVPAGNTEMLSRRILDVIQNRDLGLTLGMNGKNKVLRELDVRFTVKKIEEIYQQIFDKAIVNERVTISCRQR